VSILSTELVQLFSNDFFPFQRVEVVTVACIVETKIPSGLASLVRVGLGLEVTPWHPIKGLDGLWRFPCEVT
jgi:hypothetical protein